MTRPEVSAAILALGDATPGLAGAHLVEAGRAIADGTAEMRGHIVNRIKRVASTLRIVGGPVADAYGKAAEIVSAL